MTILLAISPLLAADDVGSNPAAATRRADSPDGGHTVAEPPGGNLVVIESKQVDPGATGVTLEISIASEVDLTNLTIPLIARSISGGAFWTANLDTLPVHGRLSGALTDVRVLNKNQLNYTSPDPILLAYLRLFAGNCLTSGTLQGMTGLRFDVGTNQGVFEVDTALYPPANNLAFIDCASTTAIYPEFTKGVVTVGTPPVCACDCHADPQCDAVSDVLDVVKAVNVAFRGSPDFPDPNPSCPYVTTDVTCDGVTNVLDVVHLVNVAFRGNNPAAEFCDPCP